MQGDSRGVVPAHRLTDTYLGRESRLSVLRFRREVKTLASLNHPNIAAIYGLEEGGGVKALVLELVEGEDLSSPSSRGSECRRKTLRRVVNRQDVDLGITDQSIHDAIGPNDDFTHEGILEFWDCSA